MSTSPSRAPAVLSGKRPLPEPLSFPYDLIPAVPAGSGVTATHAAAGSPGHAQEASNAAALEAEVRAQGRLEGQAQARKAFDEQLATERSRMAETLAQFTRDRATYFQKVEGEVVQLALSIARNILHREAQIDPLLLAGIVRVALEQIDGATGVVLRIHPDHGPDWRGYLATRLDPRDLPEIIEDPAQPANQCSLETNMGVTTIGVEVQLKEIEQGFMDLLAARPGVAS
jgi:flagellar assembly protein FliH